MGGIARWALAGLLTSSACSVSAGTVDALRTRELSQLEGTLQSLAALELRVTGARESLPAHAVDEKVRGDAQRIQGRIDALLQDIAATRGQAEARRSVVTGLKGRVGQQAFARLDEEGTARRAELVARVDAIALSVNALQSEVYRHGQLTAHAAEQRRPVSNVEN